MNRSPQIADVGEIDFVGEQDGPPERLLKSRLAEFFDTGHTIDRAYLAKVKFGKARSWGVVLGLISKRGPDGGTVQEIGRIFGRLFTLKEHLDILFLTREQESRLQAVCNPFFVRKAAPSLHHQE